jgi:hypothetical protein
MSGFSGLLAIEIELKSFVDRAFAVDVDDSAELIAVRSAQGPEVAYLRRFGVDFVRLDRRPVRWTACRAVVDDDETEQTWTAEGAVQVSVRHSFEAGWRTRLALTNLAPAAWTAVVGLAMEAGPACRTWLLSSSAESTLAVVPTRIDAAILTGRAVGAPLSEAAGPALEVGPVSLEPDERFVAAWSWRGERRTPKVAERLPAELPRWPTVEVGGEIWVPADADTAVVAPGGIAVIEESDRRVLSSAEPGRHRVELRSARGSSQLDLAWVRPLPDFLGLAAERLLAVPPDKTGIVRLADLAAALVVQRAAHAAGFPAAVAASEALDLFTARFATLVDPQAPEPSSPWAAIYLIGEYDRLGDADLLADAERRLAATSEPQPGLGLATLRSRLANVVAGRPAQGSVAGPLRNQDPTQDPAHDSINDVATALELRLAIAGSRDHAEDPLVSGWLYRVGVELAAGLPARAPAGLSDAELGHCLAVLHVVPETWQQWWSTHFGGSLSELVQARTLDLVDRLDTAPVSSAHAWLTLLG